MDDELPAIRRLIGQDQSSAEGVLTRSGPLPAPGTTVTRTVEVNRKPLSAIQYQAIEFNKDRARLLMRDNKLPEGQLVNLDQLRLQQPIESITVTTTTRRIDDVDRTTPPEKSPEVRRHLDELREDAERHWTERLPGGRVGFLAESTLPPEVQALIDACELRALRDTVILREAGAEGRNDGVSTADGAYSDRDRRHGHHDENG